MSYRDLGMTPYHRSANSVVMVGAMGMLLFACLGVPHPWTGFFVGSIPVFLILVAHHVKEEAEWDRIYGGMNEDHRGEGLD